MKATRRRSFVRSRQFQSSLAGALVLTGVASGAVAFDGDRDDARLRPGNLLVSRVIYDSNANNIAPGAQLPPNCAPTTCVAATDNGVFPYVFNNVLVDGSFGITAKIVLDQMTASGEHVSSLELPNSAQPGITPTRDQMVDSFSSKSELALNLSNDREHVAFMGYLAKIDAIDVSNSNTPGVVDPTNPVSQAYYRVIGDVDREGKFRFTLTNAYSGNNGRAAILRHTDQGDIIYTAGNAGNGGNPQPAGVVLGAGAQILAAADGPEVDQNPGQPTPVGSFNVTELGVTADKIGKDDNFRGLREFGDVLYFTKGSGSNGVNTVYFIDTTGTDAYGQPLACPNGVGLPKPSAKLPNAPLAYNPTTLAASGLPSNMCILKGFPSVPAKKATVLSYPFGIWFANRTTLYVADEGNGSTKYDVTKGTYTDAAAQTTAGLQKWVLDPALGQWKPVYTLQAGLNLGAPYTVPGYPTGNNSKTNLPWSPATDGLRNLIGRVDDDGEATIWAVTSTVSGSGDQGADPNKLVRIVDRVAATSLPTRESFATIRTAGFAEVLRGVSFTPGTEENERRADR
jgi:hypothetical protein